MNRTFYYKTKQYFCWNSTLSHIFVVFERVKYASIRGRKVKTCRKPSSGYTYEYVKCIFHILYCVLCIVYTGWHGTIPHKREVIYSNHFSGGSFYCGSWTRNFVLISLNKQMHEKIIISFFKKYTTFFLPLTGFSDVVSSRLLLVVIFILTLVIILLSMIVVVLSVLFCRIVDDLGYIVSVNCR